MSKVDQLLRHWQEPRWWRRTALPYLLHNVIIRDKLRDSYYDFYYQWKHGGRRNLLDRDWDNLVILDACRYDIFKEMNTMEGILEPSISRGATSGEFLFENFEGGTFYDTVYVTANPHVSEYAGDHYEFHDIVPVWRNGWDSDLKTVPPDVMVEATLEAYERYPEKRLISHFMQPHAPYIGPTAKEKLGVLNGTEAAKWMAENEDEDSFDREQLPTVWYRLRKGSIGSEQVESFYKENLDLVLPHVEALVSSFDETTVVTADHGEMFGKYAVPFPRRIYGHNENYHTKELVKVPWLKVKKGERKDIVNETPQHRSRQEDKEARRKLQDLGYIDREGR